MADRAEELAKEHLEARFLGAGRVVSEPDGNIPPDLLVDGRIAVEVTRLNQLHDSPAMRPLIETEIPFMNGLRDIANRSGDGAQGMRMMYVEYRRTLPLLRSIRAELSAYFQRVADSSVPEGLELKSIRNLRIKCVGVNSDDASRPFHFGWVDLDSGGDPTELLQAGVRSCVADKSSKIDPYRHRYPEWWLILIDYLSFGADDYANPGVRSALALDHDWNRVVLVDPTQLDCFLELDA